MSHAKNKSMIFVDHDTNDKETLLGAYFYNFATIGSVLTSIFVAFWAIFILRFPPILLGFLPVGIFFGAFGGGAIGIIIFRIKYGYNQNTKEKK